MADNSNKTNAPTEKIVRTTTTTSRGVASSSSLGGVQQRVVGAKAASFNEIKPANSQAQTTDNQNPTQAKPADIQSTPSNTSNSNTSPSSETTTTSTLNTSNSTLINANMTGNTVDYTVRGNTAKVDKLVVSEGSQKPTPAPGGNTTIAPEAPTNGTTILPGQQTAKTDAGVEQAEKTTPTKVTTETLETKSSATPAEVLQSLAGQTAPPPVTPKPDVNFKFTDFSNGNVLINQNTVNKGLFIDLNYNVQSDDGYVKSIHPYTNLKIELLDTNGKAILTKDYVASTTTLQNGFQVYENKTAGFTADEIKNLPEGLYSVKFSTSNTAQPTVFENSGQSGTFTIDTFIKDGVIDNPILKDSSLRISSDVTLPSLINSFSGTTDGQKDISKIEVSANGKTISFNASDTQNLLNDFKIDATTLGLKAGDSGQITVKLYDINGNSITKDYAVFVQSNTKIPTISIDSLGNIQDNYLNKSDLEQGITLYLSYETFQYDATHDLRSANPYNTVKVILLDQAGTPVLDQNKHPIEAIISYNGNNNNPNVQGNFDFTVQFTKAQLQGLSETSGYHFAYEVAKATGNGSNIQWVTVDSTNNAFSFTIDKTISAPQVDSSINESVKIAGQTEETYIISTSDANADVVKKGLFAINLNSQVDINTIGIRIKDSGVAFQSIDKNDLKINVLEKLGLKAGNDAILEIQITDAGGNTLSKDYNVHIQALATAPTSITNVVSEINDGFLSQLESDGGLALSFDYIGNQIDVGDKLKANPFINTKIELYSKGQLVDTFSTQTTHQGGVNYSVSSTDLMQYLKNLSPENVKDGAYTLKYAFSQDGGTSYTYINGDGTGFVVDTSVGGTSIDTTQNPLISNHYFIDSNDTVASNNGWIANDQKGILHLNTNQSDIVKAVFSVEGKGSFTVNAPTGGTLSDIQVDVMKELKLERGQDYVIKAVYTDKIGNSNVDAPASYNVHIQALATAPTSITNVVSEINDGFLSQLESDGGLALSFDYIGNQIDVGDKLKANPFINTKIELYSKGQLVDTFSTQTTHQGGVNYSVSSTDLMQYLKNLSPENVKDGAYTLKYAFSQDGGTSYTYINGDGTGFVVDTSVGGTSIDTTQNPLISNHYFIDSNDTVASNNGWIANDQKGILHLNTNQSDIVKAVFSVEGKGSFTVNAPTGGTLSDIQVDVMKELKLERGQDYVIKAVYTDKIGNSNVDAPASYNVHIQALATAPTSITNVVSEINDGFLSQLESDGGLALSFDYIGNQIDVGDKLKANPFINTKIELYSKGQLVDTFSTQTTHQGGVNYSVSSTDLMQYLKNLSPENVKDGAYTLKYAFSQDGGTSYTYINGDGSSFIVDTTITKPTITNNQINDDYIISSQYNDADVGKLKISTNNQTDIKEIKLYKVNTDGTNTLLNTINATTATNYKFDVASLTELEKATPQNIKVEITDNAGNVSSITKSIYIQDVATKPTGVTFNGSNILDSYLNSAEANTGTLFSSLQYIGNQYESNSVYGLKANAYTALTINLNGQNYSFTVNSTDGINYTFNSPSNAIASNDLYTAIKTLSDGAYTVTYTISNGTGSSLSSNQSFTVDKTLSAFSVDLTKNQDFNGRYLIDSNNNSVNKGSLFATTTQNDIKEITLIANGKTINATAGTSFTARLIQDFGYTYNQDATLTAIIKDNAGNTRTDTYNFHILDKATAPISATPTSSNVLDSYLNASEINQGLTMALNYTGNQNDSIYGPKANPFNQMYVKLYSVATGGSLTELATSQTFSMVTDASKLLYTLNLSTVFATTTLTNLNNGNYALKYFASNGIDSGFVDTTTQTNFAIDKIINPATITNSQKGGSYFINSEIGNTALGKLYVSTNNQTDIQKIELYKVNTDNTTTLINTTNATSNTSYTIDTSSINQLAKATPQNVVIKMYDMAGNISTTTNQSIYIQDTAPTPTNIKVNGANSLSNNDIYINSTDPTNLNMSLEFIGNTTSTTYGLSANPYNQLTVNLTSANAPNTILQTKTYIASDFTTATSNNNIIYTLSSKDIFSTSSLADGSYNISYSLASVTPNSTTGVVSSTFGNTFIIDRTINAASIDSTYFYDNQTPNNPNDDFYVVRTIDTTKPNPLNDDILSGKFDNNAYASLQLSITANGITKTVIPTISGDAWTVSNFSGQFSNTVQNTLYDLNIKTTDLAGNSRTDVYKIFEHTIQTSAPVITSASVASDANGEYIGTIKGTADPFSKIQFYSIDPTTYAQTSTVLTTTFADAKGNWSLDPVYAGTGAKIYQPGATLEFLIASTDMFGSNTSPLKSLIQANTLSAANYNASSNSNDNAYSQNSAIIYGFAGNDKVTGNIGNDWLFGGIGNDTLWGGAGNDFLMGGAGGDWLYGQTGSDTFIYQNISDSYGTWAKSGTPTADVLYSFSASEFDKIDVSQLLTSLGLTSSAKFINTGTLTSAGSTATSALGTFWLGSDSYLYAHLQTPNSNAADFAVYLSADDTGTAFSGTNLTNLLKYLDPKDTTLLTHGLIFVS